MIGCPQQRLPTALVRSRFRGSKKPVLAGRQRHPIRQNSVEIRPAALLCSPGERSGPRHYLRAGFAPGDGRLLVDNLRSASRRAEFLKTGLSFIIAALRCREESGGRKAESGKRKSGQCPAFSGRFRIPSPPIPPSLHRRPGNPPRACV